MPSDVLRRPLLSVFDIFRHGFTHPPIKKREKKTAYERLIKDSVVANEAWSNVTSKKVIQRLNRTCTRLRPFRLSRPGPLVFSSHHPHHVSFVSAREMHPSSICRCHRAEAWVHRWLTPIHHYLQDPPQCLFYCFLETWDFVIQAALELEQRFKSVEWCHCYVETWKYTVALWPWKNSSTRVAYGGFVQAYGRVWLAPFSWRPLWGGLRQAIHKSCWSAFLSTWALE